MTQRQLLLGIILGYGAVCYIVGLLIGLEIA